MNRNLLPAASNDSYHLFGRWYFDDTIMNLQLLTKNPHYFKIPKDLEEFNLLSPLDSGKNNAYTTKFLSDIYYRYLIKFSEALRVDSEQDLKLLKETRFSLVEMLYILRVKLNAVISNLKTDIFLLTLSDEHRASILGWINGGIKSEDKVFQGIIPFVNNLIALLEDDDNFDMLISYGSHEVELKKFGDSRVEPQIRKEA